MDTLETMLGYGLHFFLNSKFKNMGICFCYGNYLSSAGTKPSLLSDLTPPEILLIVWMMQTRRCKPDAVLHDINHFIISPVFSACRGDIAKAKSRIGICF